MRPGEVVDYQGVLAGSYQREGMTVLGEEDESEAGLPILAQREEVAGAGAANCGSNAPSQRLREDCDRTGHSKGKSDLERCKRQPEAKAITRKRFYREVVARVSWMAVWMDLFFFNVSATY